MKRVAVDLTPLLAGGDNGGIKPLALELVRGLAVHAPDCEFILLTSAQSHDGLAHLDAPNVRRVCVSHPEAAPTPSLRRAFTARRLLQRLLPAAVVEKLGALYVRKFQSMPAESSFTAWPGRWSRFGPFTGIFFLDPSVPVVSVVADLHISTTRSSSPLKTATSASAISVTSASVASRVVCISEYTRDTVLEHSDLTPDRAAVIHIAASPIPARPARPAGRYLLYPAQLLVPQKSRAVADGLRHLIAPRIRIPI